MNKIGDGSERAMNSGTQICMLDGEKGRLVYRNIDAKGLAVHHTFEEVCYLLWYGKLPSEDELELLKEKMYNKRRLPKQCDWNSKEQR